MKNSKLNCNTQIRLTLPQEWVHELDVISKANNSTRLALIRKYIRLSLNQSLDDANEILKQTRQRDACVRELNEWSNNVNNNYHPLISRQDDW